MNFPNWQRNAAIAASVLLVGTMVYYFSNIVAYVLVAWALSMVGQPLMDLFTKKLKIGKFQISNSVAAILTLFIFFIFTWILLSMFIPLVAKQAAQIANADLESITSALQQPINSSYGRCCAAQ